MESGKSSVLYLSVHMSSSHPLPSSSTEPKKKFGKNLNKLTKPPPPQPSATTNAASRGGATGGASSSRNGLLLLSTKRSSSFGTSSVNGGGSLLAPKPKPSTSFGQPTSSNISQGAPRPLNTPSLRSETSYDTLLNSSSGTVSGSAGLGGWGSAAGSNETAPTPPQPAWGLGDKTPQQQLQNSSVGAPTLAPKGRVSAGYHASIAPSSSSNASPLASSSSHQNEENEIAHLSHDSKFSRRQKHERNNTRSSRLGDSYENDGHIANSRKPESVPPAQASGGNFDTSQSSNGEKKNSNLSDSSLLQNLHSNLSKRSAEERFLLGEQEKGVEKKTQASPARHYHHVNDFHDDRHDDNVQNVKNNVVDTKSKHTVAETYNSNVDDQVEFMKKRARERAEVLRVEEQARVNEQKERAARRLKKLEEQMSASNGDVPIESTKNRKSSQAENWRSKSTLDKHESLQQGSEIVLERLGSAKDSVATRKANQSGAKKAGDYATSNTSGSRTLFDPNRTYSSLVGGSKTTRSNSGDLNGHSNLHKSQPQGPPVATVSHPVNDPPLFSVSIQHDTGNDSPPPVAVIQLSNYEDRNRGERGISAGPRMLFDPKSGSMIQAPSFDKRNAHNHNDDSAPGGKSRRERSKQKTRSTRERDSKSDFKRLDSTGTYSSMEEMNRRKNSSNGNDDTPDLKSGRRDRRKEDGNSQWKDRHRGDKESRGSSSNINELGDFLRNSVGREDSGISSKNNSKRHGGRGGKGRPADAGKLPRTRGVLYKLNESGNYVCADGCDADLGFGAHSVPGGRVRNPSAFVPYIEQQQFLLTFNDLSSSKKNIYEQWSIRDDQQNMHQHLNSNMLLDPVQMEDDHYHQLDAEIHSEESLAHGHHQRELYSGNTVPSFARDQTYENDSKLEEVSYDVPSHMRVKPNETLSILAGIPDSPELQATAHPWAPSKAALEAAAAVAAATTSTNIVDEEHDDGEASDIVAADLMRIIDDSEDSVDSSDLDSDSSFYGLGFDPAENMDSMITSPTLISGNVDDEDGVNMSALSLEPAAKIDVKADSNPFSPLGTPSHFLGSSTWATGGSLTRSPHSNSHTGLSMGSLNWDLLGSRKNDMQIGPHHTSITNGQPDLSSASSIFGLSPLTGNQDRSTWGSSRIRTGITGLGGTPLSNAHASGDGANIAE